ncbi:MAG: NifB/NifX family molybdenum-iron cluster-binding protein [Ectothiorhodospira sp.]
MKIAFTSQGTTSDALMDPRFGRTAFLLVYDEESGQYEHCDNRQVEGVAHGAAVQTARRLFEMGAQVLVTGNGPGGNAASVLQRSGVQTFIGAGGMTVERAYAAWKSGELQRFQ